MVHTVVVPLDGSPFSEQAISPAERIAHRLRAELELVRVHERQVPSILVSGAPVLDPQLDFDQHRDAKEYLETIAHYVRGFSDVPVRVALLDGDDVVDALAEHLAQLDAAFVVMSTHARKGLRRVVVGSVTTRLVMRSPVPVLAVRPSERTPPSALLADFHRVLLPVEELELGLEVAERTVEIAGTTGNEYVLMHVVNPLSAVPPPEPPVVLAVPDLDAAEQAARELLSVLADRLRERGVSATAHIEIDADPARAIRDFASSRQIDLIGMATHGFRGVKRVLLGSVSEEVLRTVQVPVLLMRPYADARATAHAGAGRDRASG